MVHVLGGPQGSEIHLWRAGIWDDCGILFTDMAGSTRFLKRKEEEGDFIQAKQDSSPRRAVGFLEVCLPTGSRRHSHECFSDRNMSTSIGKDEGISQKGAQQVSRLKWAEVCRETPPELGECADL